MTPLSRYFPTLPQIGILDFGFSIPKPGYGFEERHLEQSRLLRDPAEGFPPSCDGASNNRDVEN
jgi:hypothetical protein